MVQRVTYRRRLSYNTKSNKTKLIRTPGGKLVLQVRFERHMIDRLGLGAVLVILFSPDSPKWFCYWKDYIWSGYVFLSTWRSAPLCPSALWLDWSWRGSPLPLTRRRHACLGDRRPYSGALSLLFSAFMCSTNYQGIWRSFEPQGSEGKDREGFPHRGAKNSYEGSKRARQELRSEELIKCGRQIILACSCPTYVVHTE